MPTVNNPHNMSATRSLTSSKKKKSSKPFYDTSGIRTSAQIIEEARQKTRGALPTDRPFTPAEFGRNLFGSHGSLSRPPSVYSIGARHFSDEKYSRPSTSHKLAPIEKAALEDESFKVSSRTKIHPTPPTPVQSFYDLSSASSDHVSSHRSISTEHTLKSGSRTSIISTESVESSSAELKQSRSSPRLSKRSLSAGAGKRVLSAESTRSPGSSQVVSTGNRGDGSSRVVSAGNREDGNSQVVSASNRGDDSSRVVSAGNRGDSSSRVVSAGNKSDSSKSRTQEKSPKCDQSVSESTSIKATKQSSRKSSVTATELPVWESEVQPLLKRLDATPYDNTSELCETCDLLWTSLVAHSLLGRTGGLGGTKKRGSVLRTVFRLLDHKNPHLLLKVSKIILAMKVTSKNLLNVCKLLFAIAKSDKNDDIFKEENICGLLVELLSTADLNSDPEALVYGLGTVKLLASNSGLRGQLGEAGVMRLLADTLQSCTDTSQSSDKKLIRNILVQLSGALRNLSDAIDLREQFLSNSILARLVSVISDHVSDVEIIFNISRLFSKLTIQPECQVAVMQSGSLLPLLLQILTVHSSHPDITVRVCFILGNLVADDPEARETIFFRHSSLSVLNSVFDHYLNCLLEKVDCLAAQSGTSSAKNTTHNVLVKLVRLVANLSVHPEVGPAISQDKDIVDHLFCILGLVSLSDQEELVLNTLATLNNLTYYSSSESSISQRQTELAELLLKVVLVDNSEGLLECTRVYGNLSRHPQVRKILTDNKVDEMMVTLLDSDRREMVYCACGVLVNIMADSQLRSSLSRSGGIRKLVEVLHDFGGSDWQLATLVCKILWNYSENMSSTSTHFGEEEVSKLLQLLQNFSSESFALNYPPDIDETNKQLLSLTWQSEFLPISNALLKRIQTHHSQLEPLSTKDYHS